MKSLLFRKSLLMIVVCSLCAAYTARFMYRGWVAHDEGFLAQAAERVLAGELPHRDFDDVYPGGLSFLHALSFKLLGARLTSLRWMLFFFFVAFLPALYLIAVRVVSPLVAGLVVLLCVSWSLPNYFASLGSWYNLFFATFGTLALLYHVDTAKPRWLFLAGVFGGLSLLMKPTGAYFVAAAILYLLCHEQTASSRPHESPQPRSLGFSLVKGLSLALLVLAVVILFRRHPGFREILNFILPVVVIIGYIMWSEVREGRGLFLNRVRSFFSRAVPFAFGLSLPIMALLLTYIAEGALYDLYRGIFVLPRRRLQHIFFPMPHPLTLATTLPYTALLVSSLFYARHRERSFTPFLGLMIGGLFFSAQIELLYRFSWLSVRVLLPIVVLVGCLFLWKGGRTGILSDKKRLEILLMLSMASFLSLVQYPFAASIYFCYVAPFVALAVVYLVTAKPEIPGRPHFVVLVFYLLFAVLWLNSGFINNLGVVYWRNDQVHRLDLPRAGIFVSDIHKRAYERLVAEIQRHAVPGAAIFATPDCPEVYFLAGMKNPTRVMYDFFDDAQGRSERILDILDKNLVKVVVINRHPESSPQIERQLNASLQYRFPNKVEVEWFTLRWRD